MVSKLHKQIAKSCLKSSPEEACGFICDGKVISVKNISTEPCDSFVIGAQDYVEHLPDTIYHSHPTGTTGFSEHDRCVAANMGLTSYVYIIESDRLEKYSAANGIELFENVLGKQ